MRLQDTLSRKWISVPHRMGAAEFIAELSSGTIRLALKRTVAACPAIHGEVVVAGKLLQLF